MLHAVPSVIWRTDEFWCNVLGWARSLFIAPFFYGTALGSPACSMSLMETVGMGVCRDDGGHGRYKRGIGNNLNWLERHCFFHPLFFLLRKIDFVL